MPDHVVADAHRAARRTEPRPDLPERCVEFQDQAINRLDLADALARLPKEQRHVIELKYLVGCTNADVGQALGKSVGAINTLQWRALARLKRMVEPR